MKERGILFLAPMVRAILEGRKSQTRRVIVPRSADLRNLWHCYPGNRWSIRAHPGGGWLGFGDPNGIPQKYLDDLVVRGRKGFPCPHGVAGDRLWVRETWGIRACFDKKPIEKVGTGNLFYRADYDHAGYDGSGEGRSGVDVPILRWRPSIFMPRWASRLLLDLVSVRVERVQEITAEDARAEGVKPDLGHAFPSYRATYSELWDSLNARRGFPWSASPWVWVLEFKRAN